MVKFAKWAKIDGPAHMSTHTPIRMFMRTFEYKVTHMSTNQFENVCLHILPHACLRTYLCACQRTQHVSAPISTHTSTRMSTNMFYTCPHTLNGEYIVIAIYGCGHI